MQALRPFILVGPVEKCGTNRSLDSSSRAALREIVAYELNYYTVHTLSLLVHHNLSRIRL